MSAVERVIIIVLDSAGVGFLPDAGDYDDLGANTIGHIAEAVGLDLPNLQRMGLGNIININGIEKESKPIASFGKAAEKSKGKDTTVGHWEIGGVITEQSLPTYPEGFPSAMMYEFEKRIGRKTIGNKVASGTEIINELGPKHMKTGYPIIYTSADSVFQIAAHEEVIPVDQLYEFCWIAREMFPVGRVIARPFIGVETGFERTDRRHDFSLEPTGETMFDRLSAAGLDVVGIGKTSDIFAGRGITEDYGVNLDNLDGIIKTDKAIKEDSRGVIFTNLVDFDMKYGHRRDPAGYKAALGEFDSRLPGIMNSMKENDLLIITADHGCDPIFKGTDHTREYIPIVAYGRNCKSVSLGIRDSFKDIADTVDELLLGIKRTGSFADMLV